MSRQTVSLVISVWNRQADLRDNLRACLQQTVPADEIIVVDNCSLDGTKEMVRAEFPQVKLVCMPHSAYGACETFNIGFASAGGEFVGILDDDVYCRQGSSNRCWRSLRKNPLPLQSSRQR